MHMHLMCAAPQRPEEGKEPPGTGVTDRYELVCGCQERAGSALNHLSHLSSPLSVHV